MTAGPRILAIDTSGELCSAALALGDRIEQRLEHAPRGHSSLILPMMQALLDTAGVRLRDLDAIAFGRGPGSFTGVRIATAVAQGAAFGADLPLLPISTLAALALGAYRRGGQRQIAVALDARMDEVYWGCFHIGADGQVKPCCAEAVAPPGRVEVPAGADWFGVGPGWAAYAADLRGRFGDRLGAVDAAAACEAQDIAQLGALAFARGEAVAPELAAPRYLRDQVTRAP